MAKAKKPGAAEVPDTNEPGPRTKAAIGAAREKYDAMPIRPFMKLEQTMTATSRLSRRIVTKLATASGSCRLWERAQARSLWPT